MSGKMAEATMASSRPIDAPAWGALQSHYEKIKDVHLRQLFAEDPKRGTRLTAEGAGLYLDYSKNRVTDETMGLFAVKRSTSPRSAPFCTLLCVRRAEPQLRWTAKT